MRRTWRLTLALAVIGAACSDGGDTRAGGTDGPDPTPSVDSSPDTTVPASTTTTTQTTAAPRSCTADPIPDDARNFSAVEADLDGDGQTDRLMTYASGQGEDLRPWVIRVETAAGAAIEAEAPVESSYDAVRPLGAANVGGATPTGFVAVDSGASTTVVTLVALDGCDVVFPSLPGRDGPALLPVGGSVGSAAGLACSAGDDSPVLVVRTASSGDGESYSYEETALRRDGAVLTEVAETSGTLDAGDEPGRLGDFYTLQCPGVTPP